MRGVTAGVVLVCLYVPACALLAEGTLRAFGYGPGTGFLVWSPDFVTTFRPAPGVMPGIDGISEFRTSSVGLRADEVQDSHRFRILALGGSTTECLYLDQQEAWPQLLQQSLRRARPELRPWVGNAGVSGTTTRHHVVAIEHLPLKEWKISVVLLLVGVNDLMVRLAQGERYDADFLGRPGARGKLTKEMFRGARGAPRDSSVLERTALWRALSPGTDALTKATIQDDAGRLYAKWRSWRGMASDVRRTLPDLESALGEYERNLEKIIDLLEEQSIRVVFLTQPAIWQAESPAHIEALLWMGGTGHYQARRSRTYYASETLHAGMAAYNDRLKRVCKRRGTPCIDLAAVLPRDTSIFYDDVHFNETGARAVADAVRAGLDEFIPGD